MSRLRGSLTALKSRVRSVLKRVEVAGVRLCARFPYLSNWWFIVDRGFEREHHAVLRGRVRYMERSGETASLGSRFLLRRNTHRIEKGLIMKDRRPIFAADYAPETVAAFCELVAGGTSDQGTFLLASWAHDVLSSYFDAVEPGRDRRVDDARARFDDAQREWQASSDGERRPFRRDTTPLAITIDDLLDLARRRRSVRWYLDRPVPRAMIDRAVEVAGYAPSACNRQPWEFRFFDDPELVRRVAAIPMGTKGFDHQFPVVMVIVGKLYAFPFTRDRHVPYIDASLAAMALEFALEVQGLATCSINWPDISALEAKMARVLGLAPDERVIMCMSVGFPDPDELVPYSQKKSLHELRSYNRTISSVSIDAGTEREPCDAASPDAVDPPPS